MVLNSVVFRVSMVSMWNMLLCEKKLISSVYYMSVSSLLKKLKFYIDVCNFCVIYVLWVNVIGVSCIFLCDVMWISMGSCLFVCSVMLRVG